MQIIWGSRLAIGLLVALVQPGFADEQMVPLAISGNWAALEHRDSLTAPPDVCLVINAPEGLAFRASLDGKEVRVVNSKWSLPSNVTGSIQIKVGSVLKSFDIGSNTDTMVGASVSDEDMIEVFNAMDQSQTLTLTAGKSKPQNVSLSGSSRATNAFRTCAGLNSNDKKAGENPFQ